MTTDAEKVRIIAKATSGQRLTANERFELDTIAGENGDRGKQAQEAGGVSRHPGGLFGG